MYIKSDYFIPLKYPDPHGFGDKYRPIFPPRHTTLKTIMDNLPDTIEQVWIFGSSIRWDAGTLSGLDVLLVGELSKNDYFKIINAVPDGQLLNILDISSEELHNRLNSENYSIYDKIMEMGYLFYEKETKL